MPTVARPMPIRVMNRTGLRPILSPSAPKNRPPSGRIRKATPKVAKVASIAVNVDPLGKKCVARIRALSPYKLKS